MKKNFVRIVEIAERRKEKLGGSFNMRFAEVIGYLLSNATLTEEEYLDMSRKMSTQASRTTRSFADLMFDKGETQGKEIGQIAMLVNVMRKHPDWSDQQVADFFDVDIELARKARQSSNNLN